MPLAFGKTVQSLAWAVVKLLLVSEQLQLRLQSPREVIAFDETPSMNAQQAEININDRVRTKEGSYGYVVAFHREGGLDNLVTYVDDALKTRSSGFFMGGKTVPENLQVLAKLTYRLVE